MADVYIHYAIDPAGIAFVLFSGSQTEPKRKITNQQAFAMAVANVKQVPFKKREWVPENLTWEIDSEYWEQRYKFFQVGAPIFQLVPHATVEEFEEWRDGITTNNFKAMPENKAAKNFFNNFNQVIEKTAVAKSDREMLTELLGFKTWAELDASDRITLRKAYRAAAMRLHPDRNAGDGSKMAILNQLWGAYVNN